MPKSLYIDPVKVREPGYIHFEDIPVCQYNKTIKQELEEGNYTKEDLIRIYRDMAICREFEHMLTLIKTQANYNGVETTYPGPAHLSLGQEASCVGEAYLLTKDDITFGSHRSHSEILSKGLSCINKLSDEELMSTMENFLGGKTLAAVKKFADTSDVKELAIRFLLYGTVAEIFARENGFHHGMGGSMHAFFLPFGIYPNNAIVGGFQGQRQWTDFYPNCDFPESILNSSFDWNGAREPYILGTENDTLNATSMLFMKLLTGRAQMFADVRTYWSGDAVKRVTGYELEGRAKEADGFIHLINSGACCVDACGEVKDENGNPVMKKWWDVTDADIDTMMNATTWPYADLGYFRGGGYSSRFVTRAEMPATMIRLNLIKGLGPVLQIVEGWTVKLPDEVTDKLWKRTDYTWPCTWFTPRVTGKGAFKSAYDVMNNWGANHGAISYGHIGADLITMCSMLRIPVCMHNVDENDIYRPSAWGAFGMDKEGQDYRACAAYGPLYKNIRK